MKFKIITYYVADVYGDLTIDTNPMLTIYFVASTHQSVFNDLTQCIYIVPRHFYLAYKPSLYNSTIKSQLIQSHMGFDKLRPISYSTLNTVNINLGRTHP